MIDVELVLRKVLKSGKYYIGSKRTVKALKRGEVKAVVVSNNCPEKFIEKVREFNVPVLVFNGTNMQLGEFCRKPFSIALMGITEEIE